MQRNIKLSVMKGETDMRFMKRAASILLAIVCAFTMCACGTADDGSKEDFTDVSAKIDETELPEDEIIFIKRYMNGASGYEDKGYFVDSDGAAYAFDFSQDTYDVVIEEENFLDKLRTLRGNTEPFATVDREILQEMYYYGMQIDPEAECSEESMACDMGQIMLIFHNTDTDECIVCYEDGDVIRELQDVNAHRVVDIYEKKMEDKLFGM